MNQQTSPRARAVATQESAIQNNIARIEADRQQRPTAIQAMAGRLNLTPAKLQETLRQTVFREANDAEFAALIVVANEYKLNPLLKEIFAFKAKGGGIIPYVSVDGWIRIINEHPQFDGIEFNDIVDEKGELYAIESVIWRKDRTRPIKVTEYMDECRRDTDPWKKSPKRFLRHRSIMQGGRVAFGFSGIVAEEDYEVVGYAPQPAEARNVTLPRREELPPHDAETGEVLSREQIDELDRDGFRQMDGHEPEGRDDREMGEGHNDSATRAEHEEIANALIGEINGRASVVAITNILKRSVDEIEALPDDLEKMVMDAADARKAEVK